MDRPALLEYFKLIDQDNNGLIDRDEFHRMLKTQGLQRTADVVARAFDDIDSDRNGLIDQVEFLKWWGIHGASLPTADAGQTTIKQLKATFADSTPKQQELVDMEGFRQVLASLGQFPSAADLRLTFSQTTRQDPRYFTFDELLQWWLRQVQE